MKINKKFFMVDNTRYDVIETVTYRNKTYVYLVNNSDEFDSMFREVVKVGNKYELEKIDTKLFKSKISSIFEEKRLSA